MRQLKVIWRFIRARFNLKEDQDNVQEVMASIRKGIVFQGTNLWTLVFAIVVASVGLNVNSTAVVIGAMLISPLMGPIMGVGLGVGIYDFELIKHAAKNLAIMVLASVVTSMVYFLISPLKIDQPELLARTTPSIWDVLLAFSGGMAGIIAATRLEKGTVVAGVAIATALMPPLCTAGYGLAIGNFYYALGALYLFSINAVFISFSALLVVRILRFPKQEFVSAAVETRVRRNVAAIVLVTLVPSVFFAFHIVKKTIFEQRVDVFVQKLGAEDLLHVIRMEKKYNRKGSTIRLETLDGPIDSLTRKRLNVRLLDAGLNEVHLEVEPFGTGHNLVDPKVLRFNILEDLYQRNETTLQARAARIDTLERALARYQRVESEVSAVARELKALQPGIQEFTLNSNIYYNYKNAQPDTIPVAYLRFERPLQRDAMDRIYDWLKARIASDTLILIKQ
jgi:uncharacterized hydrophobic protein (TIGR00271 family)